ncbi:hypothetical protein, partial [Okeania sp. SIO3I5]|uniref:hypothetical protein n=1 Tax=Okeania sp. SIO3I5 TaxID=2607805 RepID=UPI00260150C3
KFWEFVQCDAQKRSARLLVNTNSIKAVGRYYNRHDEEIIEIIVDERISDFLRTNELGRGLAYHYDAYVPI